MNKEIKVQVRFFFPFTKRKEEQNKFTTMLSKEQMPGYKKFIYMSKTVKWILWGTIGLVVILIILKVAGVFGKDEGTKVTAENVQRRTITEIVNASGKIYPSVEVKVSSDNSGEVTELDVQEGDTVKKGQILARIYADVIPFNVTRQQVV